MSDKASAPAGSIPPGDANTAPIGVSPVSATDAKATDALAIAGRAHDRVDGLAERFDELEGKVLTLTERGIGAAETGALGNDAKAGAGIVQEIIDFLHHLFPGHGAPGIPSTAGDPVNPAP